MTAPVLMHQSKLEESIRSPPFQVGGLFMAPLDSITCAEGVEGADDLQHYS